MLHRWFTFTAILLTAVFLISGKPAQAADWTGCLTPGGTIIHVAKGKDPARPCVGQHRRVHFEDFQFNQHPEADYDQATICKAFHELLLSPELLEELGCHPEPTNVILGDLRTVPTCDILGGFCVWEPDYSLCGGAMKIEANASGTGYEWTLPGAFIRKSFVHNFVNDRQACRDACETDSECLAAHQSVHAGASSATCLTFHKSDGIEEPYRKYCGPSQLLCSTSNEELWFLRCEGPL